MPSDRTLLGRHAGVRIEQVRYQAAPQWGGIYRTDGHRIVLPSAGALRMASAGRDLLADPLMALHVPAATEYRLRPEGAHCHIVASDAAFALPAAGAWWLAPQALFQLRRHWRALERGEAGADQTAHWLPALLAGSAPVPGAESAAVRCVRELLVADPAAAMSLHELADHARCSGFHLARSFRRSTGLSLHGYRLRLRLAAALARLEQGERDLAGLAHDLGFSSQSHLGSVFRQAVGVAPGAARAALAA